MSDKITKKFKKYIKEYEKIRLESVKIQRKYDDAVATAKESVSKKLSEALKEVEKKEKEFTERYAKEVFDFLSETKPLLIRKRDSMEVRWIDAFGDDFTKLTPGLKQSLIALVEGKGGQYKIK